jgi:hypothetical protein
MKTNHLTAEASIGFSREHGRLSLDWLDLIGAQTKPEGMIAFHEHEAGFSGSIANGHLFLSLITGSHWQDCDSFRCAGINE